MNAPTANSLLSMMSGFWTSQAVYVAAKLGFADLIHDSPQTAEQLAAATGTNADALYRLLRALASLGLFREDGQRRFHMTDAAAPLRSGVPGSQRAVAIMMGEEHFACWGELLYSIRTGRTAFDKVYGAPVFDWLAKHPEQARIFDEAMVGVHGSETPAMVAAYDFSGVNVVADVGGGNGSLLRGVLARYPQMRGMLCDLSGVVERARATIDAERLGDRLQAIATNFFESVPAGADVYVLRHIIHDWNDEQSLAILRNVRRAVGAGGRLLVVEGVVAAANEPDFTKLLDLNMLVVPGGKERTESEYRDLLAAAGFRLASVTPTKSYVSVLDGRPV